MSNRFNFKTATTIPVSKAHAMPAAPAPVAITSTPAQSVFDAFPDSAMLRQWQLVRNPKRPNSTAPLPFSAATLWRLVKSGGFPAPVRLSRRVTAWSCASVRAWLASQTAA